MVQTLPETGFTAATFEAFLSTRNEPQWLRDLRARNWQLFEQKSLPARNEEEWMRTDIRAFRLESFAPPTVIPPPSSSQAAMLRDRVTLAGQITAVNSRNVQIKVDPDLAKKGVLFGSLDELLIEHAELLRPHFMARALRPGTDKFSALHAACWSGGTLLYVPRNVAVAMPFHALSVLMAGAVDTGHTLVVLEEGAEATLLSETSGDDQPALHCGGIEIILGHGAQLRYVNLQNWGSGTWHFAHQKAIVDRAAQLQWTIGALGSRLAKVNQHVELAGPGANVQVNGVMFTAGHQHLSYHTLQHHQAPACTSDLLYKGALQDKSHLVWRGMIKVNPGAQKTNAYQRDDNLLLSSQARADCIPGLEIEADDVVCTHGATAARVDDAQIFYAQSRGLSRNEAARLVVAGFFQQVFDRITIDSVREALGETIGARIREYT